MPVLKKSHPNTVAAPGRATDPTTSQRELALVVEVLEQRIAPAFLAGLTPARTLPPITGMTASITVEHA